MRSYLHMLVELSDERLVELLDETDRRTPFWREIHDELARRVRAKGQLTIGDWLFCATDDDSFTRQPARYQEVQHGKLTLGRLAEKRTPSPETMIGRYGGHRSYKR